MTDRELLEDAAKAVGIPLYWSEDDPECDWVQGTYPRIPDHKVLEKWTWKVWNPLTDDGDALRLAVALGADVTQHFDDVDPALHAVSVTILRPDEEAPADYAHVVEQYAGDPLAATRRAIVRAAAELGRSKE